MAESTISPSWLSSSQKVFYSLLQDEDNRLLNPADLVAKTSYDQQVWSKALRDPRFADFLESAGLYFPRFSKSHRAFLRVLRNSDSWALTAKDLAKHAGLSASSKAWPQALENRGFRTVVEKLGYPLWMSIGQRRIYLVLRDTSTHSLSLGELADKAKFATDSAFSGSTSCQRYRQFIEDDTGFCFWMTFGQRRLCRFLQEPAGRALFIDHGDDAICKSLDLSRTWLSKQKRNARLALKLAAIQIHLWMTDVQRRLFFYILRMKNPDARDCSYSTEAFASAVKIHPSTVSRLFAEDGYSAALAKDCDFYTWMSPTQRRIYRELRISKPEPQLFAAWLERNAVPASTWYASVRDVRFANIIRQMGLPLSLAQESVVTGIHVDLIARHSPHAAVSYIEDPFSRAEYLRDDVWDLRRLFQTFPRHRSPSSYIADFRIIQHLGLRKEAKPYFESLLVSNEPGTISPALRAVALISNVVVRLFPLIQSYAEFRRECIDAAVHFLGRGSVVSRSMARMSHMFYSMEQDGLAPPDDTVIRSEYRHHSRRQPRPAEIDVMQAVDSYIQDTLVPSLESGAAPEGQEADCWEAFLIFRYAALRPGSLAHMIAEGADRSLQTDDEGAPFLFIPGAPSKMKTDTRLPLGHLDTITEFGNPVVRAILRQSERVKFLPLAPDGKAYLFRQSIQGKGNGSHFDVPAGKWLRKCVSRAAEVIGLHSQRGDDVRLLPIILRHTVATELYEAGIQIERIAQFLGHSMIASAEFYVGGRSSGRPAREAKLPPSSAGPILAALLPDRCEHRLSEAKRALLAVHDFTDSICEHPTQAALCCAVPCLVCRRKEISPDKIDEVRAVIAENRVNLSNALALSLTDKASHYRTVISFHEAALEVLTEGITFIASEHYYVKGDDCNGKSTPKC